MIFINLHLGDYAKATSHLTQAEEGAYIALLRWYLCNDSAIPENKVYIIAKAFKAKEKAAVDSVLSEFFFKKDNAYHSAFAEESLSKSKARSKAAKASVSHRWGKPEGQKNDTNVSKTYPQTYYENDTNALLTNNQEPITNNQEPDLLNSSSSAFPLEAAAVFEEKKNKSAFKEKNADFSQKNEVETFENPLDLNALHFPKAPNDDFCDLQGKSLTVLRAGARFSEGEWLRDALLSELPPTSLPSGRVLKLSDLIKQKPAMRNRLLAWQKIPLEERFAALLYVERPLNSIDNPLKVAVYSIRDRPPDFLKALNIARQALSENDTTVECN